MKVIIALTLSETTEQTVKKKANRAILDVLPNACPPKQTTTKKGDLILTYSETRTVKAPHGITDDVINTIVSRDIVTELMHKLYGLHGVQKVQVWWKYQELPIRPTTVLLFV